MKFYYRMHEGFGRGTSVDYIDNIKCLNNFLSCIKNKQDLTLFLDNSSDEFYYKIKNIIPSIIRTSLGNGKSFLNCVEHAINNLNDDEIVYFVENDYIHLPDIEKYIEDGFSCGATLVSLYDHPDKYTDYPNLTSKILLGNLSHWRTSISTCMTFATKVKTLKNKKSIITNHCPPSMPQDHALFQDLQSNGELLITPIPGRCTHGEKNYLSPIIDWRSKI